MKEDLTQDQLNATFSEIFKQSDRASAIVCGGILEEILERMITSFLLPHDSIPKNLFDGLSPLSTFGAKIDLSFHLGLINETEHEDLKLIKRIRNEFAHSIKGINFDHESIKNRCYQLQTLKRTSPPQKMLDNITNIKMYFQINTTLLATILFAKSKEINHLDEFKYKNVGMSNKIIHL